MKKIEQDCKCYSCKHRKEMAPANHIDPKVCEECYDLADKDGFVFHRNWEPDYMPDKEGEEDGTDDGGIS